MGSYNEEKKSEIVNMIELNRDEDDGNKDKTKRDQQQKHDKDSNFAAVLATKTQQTHQHPQQHPRQMPLAMTSPHSNSSFELTSKAQLSSLPASGGDSLQGRVQGHLQRQYPLQQGPLQLPSSNPTIHPSILEPPQTQIHHQLHAQIPAVMSTVSNVNTTNSTATTVPFMTHQHRQGQINDAASAYAQTRFQAQSQAVSQQHQQHQHLVSALAQQQAHLQAQAVATAMNTVGAIGEIIQQNPSAPSMLNFPQHQQQQTGALLNNHFATPLIGAGHGHGKVHPSLQQHGHGHGHGHSHSIMNALALTTATTAATATGTTEALSTSTSAPTQNNNVNVASLPTPIPLPNPSLGLTVQDHPHKSPIYNGVNPNYPNLNVLNQNPPVFSVNNFLTPTECDFLINVAQDCFSPAPVVGKGAGEVSPSRTSSTCYLAREDLPRYLAKVCALTGKPVEHCELPQVGRYYPSQQYLQHFDAFDLSNEDGRRFALNGGQRTVTVLVYLNDVKRGGTTFFPNLNLDVKPQKGMALVFFPSTVDGFLDKNALHAAKPAIDTKYVSQVWIRQGRYEGLPSKRMFSSVDQAMLVQKSLIAAREGSADDGVGLGILNTGNGIGIATGGNSV